MAVEGIFYGQTDVPTRLDAAEAASQIEHGVAQFAPDHFLMAHAGVVHCLDIVAGGLAWEESIERRLDFLESKRFEGETGPH